MKTRIILILIFGIIASGGATAQRNNKKITITGTVVDKDQRPVMNAMVVIDGKSSGKLTGRAGDYKIKAKSSSLKIGVMILNSIISEEEISGRTTINLTLPITLTDFLSRQEVPDGEEEINVGYGTIKQKNMTTQVNRIKGDDNRYASYNSIYEMMNGELPGVIVKGKSIQIQGATSFMLSTEPLFVVDGIVVESVDGISPIMVKSIEVLKGSAASIYGSRGANGVILISLKGADRK